MPFKITSSSCDRHIRTILSLGGVGEGEKGRGQLTVVSWLLSQGTKSCWQHGRAQCRKDEREDRKKDNTDLRPLPSDNDSNPETLAVRCSEEE